MKMKLSFDYLSYLNNLRQTLDTKWNYFKLEVQNSNRLLTIFFQALICLK